MANEYLKPQKPLKDLNSENYFYPLTTIDQIILQDNSTRLNSLINKSDFIASRAIYYNGTKLLSSGNIFLNDNQIGINVTSIDSGYVFKVSGQSYLNGDTLLNGRLVFPHGKYVSTPSSRYNQSALEIRENDLVGSAQTDIGYAPTIGFHWSGKIASTLAFGSDGIFYFLKQDGISRAIIDGFLPGTSHGDNTADFSSYSWHKIAEVNLINAWRDAWIDLLVTNGYGRYEETGILHARIRVDGDIHYQTAQLVWSYANSQIEVNRFKMVYYQETSSVRAEIWYSIPSQYQGLHFAILNQGEREDRIARSDKNNSWVLTPRLWGHGSASCPTGSGSITSYFGFILNTSNQARFLENRGGSTVTINDAAWGHGHVPNGHTNRATIWHQRWYQSGLTYTPSGGSATTLTDCGDMVLWLSSANAGNTLQCNMALDGNIYLLNNIKAAGGRFGYDNYSYSLSAASFICNSWVRTVGNAGWYSQTHGGGWYMTDTTWLRSYNNKNIYSGSGIIRSDNGVWGNKVFINSNWIGFYNAVQGSTRYGYIQCNNNRMYFKKENGVLDNIAFDFSGGKVYNNNEFITIGSTGFRIVHNSRGAFWHWNASSGQKWFYLMFTAENAGINGGWTSVRAFYANADTGYTYHTRAYSAVWNDYAEFRKGKITEPGRVVIEHKSGIMQLCEERLAPGAKIISDTYGFAIGETKECKTPIAVTGRVLVYPYQNRNKYPLGAAVCSAPNGTVDIMTREEIKEYPERIVGTVSEIPDYEIWRAGGSTQDGPAEEIKVNGRIWVYVR